MISHLAGWETHLHVSTDLLCPPDWAGSTPFGPNMTSQVPYLIEEVFISSEKTFPCRCKRDDQMGQGRDEGVYA